MNYIRQTGFMFIILVYSALLFLGPVVNAQQKDVRAESISRSRESASICPELELLGSKRLNPATLGEAYQAQIQATGGLAPLQYSLCKGALPTGLVLSSTGLIMGIPSEIGDFRFSIMVSDSCPRCSQVRKQMFTLQVNAALARQAITVTTSPAHINVTRGQSSSHTINYDFEDPACSSQILKSNMGEFVVGSQVIETINRTLQVTLYRGEGSARETITISVELMEEVLQLGYTSFIYRRRFYTSSNTLAATSRVDITINLAGSLTVTTIPDTVTVLAGHDSQEIIQYSFAGSAFINTTMTSTKGIFCIGSEIIQTNPVTITASVMNGSGSVQEDVIISGSLVQTVLDRALSQFEYVREFTSPAGEISVSSLLTIIIDQTIPFVLTVTPARLHIPRDQESLINLTYTIRCSQEESAVFSSNEGRIMVGPETLEQVPSQLILTVQDCYGTATETLRLSSDLLRRVIELNKNDFEYHRDFRPNQNGDLLTVNTEFYITTDMSADLIITSVDLRFSDQRAEITVPRNFSPLTAQALISYSGSGLIEGKWSVDDRPVNIFSLHLLPTGSAILEIPEMQPLPTFEPGTHFLSFEIFSPSTGLPIPTIVYYVTTLDGPLPHGTLTIISPPMNATLPYQQTHFVWEADPDCSLYLIHFFPEDQNGASYSAYTRDNSYVLPTRIVSDTFKPDINYLWILTGYNEHNEITSSTITFRFRFQQDPTKHRDRD
ncbi:hypothetical protein JXQ70_14800 [bacterium]|nr:hypothetical protein [bacterium]